MMLNFNILKVAYIPFFEKNQLMFTPIPHEEIKL